MHSPQPVHESSTSSGRPCGRMACSGQLSRHAPHPWQRSVTLTRNDRLRADDSPVRTIDTPGG